MARRLCQGPCGVNRDEKFFVSERGRICIKCQKKSRSEAAHARRIEIEYGLTPAQYEELMVFQDRKCAICKQARPYRLNVDHDHKSLLTRGLLCRRCNKLLRDVRDGIDVLLGAAAYLRQSPADKLGIKATARPD